MPSNTLPAVPPRQTVDDPWLRSQQVDLQVLRLDLVHPTISGNKWYKLKYNLEEARRLGHDTLLTVGGAYSNHLYATAAAGAVYGFRTVGLVRGEAHTPLNPTLQFAQDQGMELHYVSRDDFRQRSSTDLRERWQQQFGAHYFLPEGGTNILAAKGCAEIISAPSDFDYIACCVGTGGTLAGIAVSTAGQAQLLGFSALKGGQFLGGEVDQLTQRFNGQTYDHYRLVHDYHFGGYARVKPSLIDFINTFYRTTSIPLEPIYTGKMMYGLYDMIAQGHLAAGSRILVVHSGGLQGIAGFNERNAARRNAARHMRIFI